MMMMHVLVVSSGWKLFAGVISTTNVMVMTLVAQTADIDTIPGIAALIGGVTIPFGVGWFWNRQYLAAKERHNVYLAQRVETLTDDLINVYKDQATERAAKIEAQEECDRLRREKSDLLRQLRQYESHESEGKRDKE